MRIIENGWFSAPPSPFEAILKARGAALRGAAGLEARRAGGIRMSQRHQQQAPHGSGRGWES